MSDADSGQSDCVENDEVVYRRVPLKQGYSEPGGHITSANFRLRAKENGLSVYRARYRSREEVLNVPGFPPGSFVLVSALVGRIRSLTSSAEAQLFDVFPADDANENPGHAEIRRLEGGHITKAEASKLRDIFAESLGKSQ